MAEIQILSEGYVREDEDRVGSTVSFVRDGDALVVIDPGLVASRAAILEPLAVLGVRPEEITDVVISHHHPDHTLNVALFPNATLHDHWAAYRDDLWTSREAEGVRIAEGVGLIQVPRTHGGGRRDRRRDGRRRVGVHAPVVDGRRPG